MPARFTREQGYDQLLRLEFEPGDHITYRKPRGVAINGVIVELLPDECMVRIRLSGSTKNTVVDPRTIYDNQNMYTGESHSYLRRIYNHAHATLSQRKQREIRKIKATVEIIGPTPSAAELTQLVAQFDKLRNNAFELCKFIVQLTIGRHGELARVLYNRLNIQDPSDWLEVEEEKERIQQHLANQVIISRVADNSLVVGLPSEVLKHGYPLGTRLNVAVTRIGIVLYRDDQTDYDELVNTQNAQDHMDSIFGKRN